jgi:hypothetical protein
MGKVIFDISMSLDGFMTAANQRPEEPLGEGGERLHQWAFGDDPRDREVLAAGAGGLGAGDLRAPHLRRLAAVVGGGRPHRRRPGPGVRALP